MSDHRVDPGPGRVAIIFLDRSAAMGNKPRVRTWESIARAAGARQVSLVGVPQSRVPLPDPRTAWHLLRGDAVVESGVRSTSWLRSRVAELTPDVVVFVTARVFDPVVTQRAPHVVLDLVDELSANYALRATGDSTAARRLAFRALQAPMRRFERKTRRFTTTAAGARDAERMGATWVPNLTVGDVPEHVAAPDARELVFVGSLNYEPNIEALRWFEPVWAELRRDRPGATMLIAGANPGAGVLRWLRSVPGWEVVADFPSLDEVMARGLVSIAPVRSATGFPNKVLEAAERGIPQVVSTRVTEGLGGGFPGVLLAETPAQWLAALDQLLRSPAEAARLAAAAREHALSAYVPDRFVDVLSPAVRHDS